MARILRTLSGTRCGTTTTTRSGTRSAATVRRSRSGWKRSDEPGRDPMSVAECDYTADEMMAVSAARALRDGMICFVGIGLPSTAANLARATHAPDLVLIYESGTIGAKPGSLPLSIGDGILAE